jgi:transcriptional regulator GlxA family with amidase domain
MTDRAMVQTSAPTVDSEGVWTLGADGAKSTLRTTRTYVLSSVLVVALELAPPVAQSPVVHCDCAQAGTSASPVQLAARDRRPSAAPHASATSHIAHVVGILALPGSTLFEIAAPAEVFRVHSSLMDVRGGPQGRYSLRICGLEPGPTQLTSGFAVEATHGLDDLAEADTLLVPAAERHHDPPRAVLRALLQAHTRGARIVAIRSGVFVLAAAGLLNGRRATTHWTHSDELLHRYPDIHVDPTRLFVHDGTVATAAGAAATIELCIELIRLDHGTAVASAVARHVLTAPHRAADGPQLVETPLPQTDDNLTRLLDWALARLDQPLTLADLAREANLSPRTLARRFHATLATTPLQWLLNQRIRLAQQLLETTQEPIERIAKLTGLGSPQNLRRKFISVTGKTPQSYRRTFRETAARKSVWAARPAS